MTGTPRFRRACALVLAGLLCGCPTASAGAGQVPGRAAQGAADLDGRIVRAIYISGLKHAREDRLRAQLASRVGEPYHPDVVESDRRRLDALRWFSRVDIVPRADGDGVVIDVNVAETLRALILPALGVSDQDGVTAGAGVRAIDVGPAGALLGLNARFGGATIVDASLERTTVTPGTWATLGWVTYRRASNPLFDFDERSVEVIARAGRNVTERLQVGVRGGYLRMDSGSAGVALSADGIDDLPSVGAFVLYDSIDPPSKPWQGWHLEADAGDTFGDASMWSFTLDARRYQPISARQVLVIFAMGTVQTGEVGRDLPAYLQFGLGGINSVRGWPLGARIGQNQFIGTAEYQYEVLPPRSFSIKGINLYAGLRAAAFADVGLARGTGSSATPRSAIDGYGAGLRLLVPFVDIIRLDVAWGEPGTGAHLYVGIDFKANRQRDRVR